MKYYVWTEEVPRLSKKKIIAVWDSSDQLPVGLISHWRSLGSSLVEMLAFLKDLVQVL